MQLAKWLLAATVLTAGITLAGGCNGPAEQADNGTPPAANAPASGAPAGGQAANAPAAATEAGMKTAVLNAKGMT